MVRRLLLVVSALVCATAADLPAQAAPALQVGVRPARVRVGDTFVLTARLTGSGWPEAFDLEGMAAAELVDVRDRSSAALGRSGASLVVERDFILRALVPGDVAPQAVFAAWGADTIRAAPPTVTAVASAVAWSRGTPAARRERDGVAVRDEGRPPTAVGRDGDRTRAPTAVPYPGAAGTAFPPGTTAVLPGGLPPGQGAWGGNPYGPTGWGASPPGGGWAPTAAGDPWWPEMVPRLEEYQRSAQAPDGGVRLEAGVTPLRVYQGQQITLVATASFAPEAVARLASPPEFVPPGATGAWAVDIPYAPPVPAAVGGRVQEAHTFMRAFFPTGSGSVTVEPTRLLYGMGSGGAAARPREELTTDPLEVQVVPIPTEGAPPGWGGAVGRYRVRGWVQPESVAWGESALLVLEVAGAGNVRDLARPDPGPVWGAELRVAGERADVEVRDGVVGGTKTFSWLVVPVEAGALRVGPLLFSFFDPWTGAFGQVATGELSLSVAPLPEQIQSVRP